MKPLFCTLVALVALPLSAQTPESSATHESLVVFRIDGPGGLTPEAVQALAAEAELVSVQVSPAVEGGQSAGPSAGEMVLMSLGGVAATGLYGALTMESDFSAAFWLSPLVGGATTYAIGEALGHEGNPLRTLGVSALAAIPGAALLAVVRHRVDTQPGFDWLNNETLMLAFVGYGLFNALPVAASVNWHSVTPSVQRAPTGETVPGLSLSVGL